jgi:LysM repeat protein
MSLVNDALKRASESSRQAPTQPQRPAMMPLSPPQAAPISRRHRPPVFALAAIVAVTSMVVLCVTALTTDWLGPRPTVAATPDPSVYTGPIDLIPDRPRPRSSPATSTIPTAPTPASAPVPQSQSALASTLEKIAIPAPEVRESEFTTSTPTPTTPPAIEPQAPVIVAAPAPEPAKSAESALQNYTVTSGDTLSSIAAKFFGKSTDWPKVYELNRHRIANPDRLQVGMTLQVPAK